MKVHSVQKGDSLWKISKLHGISLESLIAANPQIQNPDKIDVGMQVLIPSKSGSAMMPMPQPAGGLGHADLNVTGMENDEMNGDMGDMANMGDMNMHNMGDMNNMTDDQMGDPSAAPTDMMQTGEASTPMSGAPGYPSVPKWDGLWKYVVKNGDSLFKIAKQVGVTLEQLKAANPQVPNADKIYPGQVLNIPSSGMKMKPSSSGLSPKEQMTAPIATQPMNKEQMTAPILQPTMPKEQLLAPQQQMLAPKEMATMEKPMMTAPMVQQPVPVPPMTMPNVDIDVNYAPQEINIQQQQMVQAPAQQQPVQHQDHHHMYMMYIPVTYKKKHKKHKKHCGCKPKKKSCGCSHKHHHHDHHQMMLHHQHMMMLQQNQQMQQKMSMGDPSMTKYPKTFYREED